MFVKFRFNLIFILARFKVGSLLIIITLESLEFMVTWLNFQGIHG